MFELKELTFKERDRILTLTEVSWSDYLKLASEYPRYRISYSKNVIHIVSPGRNHERIAQTISILINAYCRKYKIPYFAFGTEDIKLESVVGKQPDASYCLRHEKPIPDLAVEVNYTSGSINDLEKYRLLGVKEVWMWQNGIVTFYELESFGDGDRYTDKYYSLHLPRLNSDFLNQYVERGLSEDNLTIETEFFTNLG